MKRALVVLGALAAVAGVAEWPLDGSAARAAADTGWTLAAAFALLAMLHARRNTAECERRIWTSLSVACAGWLGGQLLWNGYEVAHASLASPTLADLLWLAFPVAASVAVYRFAPAPKHVRRVLDFDAVAIALGTAAVTVAYNWDELVTSALPMAGRVTAVSYPVAYSIVAAVGAGAIIGAPEVLRRRDLTLVFAGLVVEGVGFSLWCPQVLAETFTPGTSLLDPIWTLGMLLIGAGALVAAGEAPALAANVHRLRRRTILPAAMLLAIVATELWMAMNHSPLAPRVGLLAAIVALGILLAGRNWFALRAVEELEAAERAALARRNHELEAFAYTASHDLKAPLVSISGFTEMLTRHLGNTADEQTVFLLSRIEANATSMQTMIGDLFAFARSGVDDGDVDSIDATALAEQVAEEWRDRAATAGMPLFVEGPLPAVRAHPARFKQALTNLVDNALRYGSGEVRVSGVDRDALAEIVVEDRGRGIPAAERERVFEVFARGEGAHASAPDGTGLGLAIVKRIVEASGGDVRYEEAAGARFVLSFPKAAA